MLEVSGKLSEARCRFVPPGKRGNNTTTVAANTNTNTNAAASSPPPLGEKGTSTMSTGGSVLDFGRASVGVEIVRVVTLQNVGKSPAVFCVDAPELKQVRTRVTWPGLGGNRAPGQCRKVYLGWEICNTYEYRADHDLRRYSRSS